MRKTLFCSHLEAESLTALRCLAYWLVPKKRKAGGQESTVDIPHLLMEGKVCLYYSCVIYLSQCNFIDQVEM